MANVEHEHTLNVWLADLLRRRGLHARQERKQANRRRIDVEIHVGNVKIALEAEQGQSSTKQREAIADADRRLHQGNADCAIAVCYPDGITAPYLLEQSRVLWAIRAPNHRAPANEVRWADADLDELVSVIKLAPMQLGNPDHAAAALSASLDAAVERLSENQKQEIARALDLPAGRLTRLPSVTPTPLIEHRRSRWNQAAKRAMLVIATAMMFQSRLDSHRHELKPEFDSRDAPGTRFTGDWPPAMAHQCARAADPIGAFDQAWDLWLAVDYKPIFATAQSALNGCPHDHAFTAAVGETAAAALALTRDISGLRHDLLGRIFHTVLDSARYDGSFYTTTPAATLLASLAITTDTCDWSDPAAVAKLRITDPACGTGTLLMAAAERIRELTQQAGNTDGTAQALIEQVLSGYDINLTATHMAATTLGLLSPTTQFRNMKIGRALLGVDRQGKAFLGSLEFLDRQPYLLPWPSPEYAVSQVDTGEEVLTAEPADLVIMNPPFTRDSLRHDQFSKCDEKRIKDREKELFAGHPNYMAGNSGAFLVLADFITKSDTGAIAAVLPLTGATDKSGYGLRKHLGTHYHVETIVTSHDPERIYFSENTSIGEMLLVCRRWPGDPEQKPPTRVINLARNPVTPAEAMSLAWAIADGTNDQVESKGYGTVQAWPAERIADGDWGAVQFLSPYLCNWFAALRRGELGTVATLGTMADIGPEGRRIRDAFTRSEMPDKDGRLALWHHDTDVTQTMAARPDTHIIAKPPKAHLAEKYWQQRGRLLLPTRMRLNTGRVLSVLLDTPVLGSAWMPCRPKHVPYPDTGPTQPHPAQWERALCVYLNSSVGVLSILGSRSNKIPSYPRFSIDDMRNLMVPDFPSLGDAALTHLAAAYAAHAKNVLLPLPQMNECSTRQALDQAVCTALDLDPETVATIRRHLAAEPSVTGRRYGG